MRDPEILTVQNGRKSITETPRKTNPVSEQARKNPRRGLRKSKRA